MAEGTIQVAPDSTGSKLRTRSRTIGANTVHEQFVALAGIDTWVAYADIVAFANGKHHLTIFNAVGSGVVVKVRKLFAVNLQTATVTGIVQRMDIRKCSAASSGTTVTPESFDTSNTALPAGVTVRTNGTVTNGNVLFPWVTSSEEETAAVGLSKALFQQAVNILMEGSEIQEVTLREGQGMTVHQNTNSTVGSMGWIMIFTVETP